MCGGGGGGGGGGGVSVCSCVCACACVHACVSICACSPVCVYGTRKQLRKMEKKKEKLIWKECPPNFTGNLKYKCAIHSVQECRNLYTKNFAF